MSDAAPARVTALRIAIATDWFAPRRGGIETQLLQLAERLCSRGHEVDVLTTTPGASDGRAFRVRRLDVPTLPWLDVALSPAVLDALHDELSRGYDVVHTHVSVVSPVGYGAAIVARVLGLPTVVTFHSVLRLKRQLLRVARAGGMGTGATVWSAVSRLVAAQAGSAMGGGAAIAPLPNGVDLAFWRKTPHRTSDAGVTLVSTSRLHRKKRPHVLLRAFARAARAAATPARLVIAGDGPERQRLERDIRALGLSTGLARAEIAGWLSAEDLRALYGTADGFVLASTRESFGIAALEARAARLPVIAMRAAGSSEFLEDDVDAFLCAGDAELASALERFIADASARARLAGSRSDLDRYDWSAVLAAHESAYGRAIARAARVAPAAG